MYARSFGDVFSPAALIVRASFSLCIRTSSALRLIDHANSRCDAIVVSFQFERRWVHGHSEGVYPVPSRTRKSSPSASVLVLWCESPRERLSLCLSSFPRNSPQPLLLWEYRKLGRIPHLWSAAFSNLQNTLVPKEPSTNIT